jgi:hypothetical protein
VKRKNVFILGAVMAIVFILSGFYYYNVSVHKRISINDVLEIQTFDSNQKSMSISNKEEERIVKEFNSIKSIRRQDGNSLPVAKIGQAILIKLNTGDTIQIYSGYAVGAGLMIETPNNLYSGGNAELEGFLKSLQ